MIDVDAIIEAVADRVAERVMVEPPSPWLTATEAAKYLRVSKAWLYERIDRVPHSKIDGKTFFNRTELDSWITNHRRETA